MYIRSTYWGPSCSMTCPELSCFHSVTICKIHHMQISHVSEDNGTLLDFFPNFFWSASEVSCKDRDRNRAKKGQRKRLRTVSISCSTANFKRNRFQIYVTKLFMYEVIQVITVILLYIYNIINPFSTTFPNLCYSAYWILYCPLLIKVFETNMTVFFFIVAY